MGNAKSEDVTWNVRIGELGFVTNEELDLALANLNKLKEVYIEQKNNLKCTLPVTDPLYDIFMARLDLTQFIIDFQSDIKKVQRFLELVVGATYVPDLNPEAYELYEYLKNNSVLVHIRTYLNDDYIEKLINDTRTFIIKNSELRQTYDEKLKEAIEAGVDDKYVVCITSFVPEDTSKCLKCLLERTAELAEMKVDMLRFQDCGYDITAVRGFEGATDDRWRMD